MLYIIGVELELPTDEYGLTDEGWEIAAQFDNAIWKLKTDYSWKEIENVGMPKRKDQLIK
jgi:hypothetical protein